VLGNWASGEFTIDRYPLSGGGVYACISHNGSVRGSANVSDMDASIHSMGVAWCMYRLRKLAPVLDGANLVQVDDDYDPWTVVSHAALGNTLVRCVASFLPMLAQVIKRSPGARYQPISSIVADTRDVVLRLHGKHVREQEERRSASFRRTMKFAGESRLLLTLLEE
jgi:hypothetical protein